MVPEVIPKLAEPAIRTKTAAERPSDINLHEYDLHTFPYDTKKTFPVQSHMFYIMKSEGYRQFTLKTSAHAAVLLINCCFIPSI